VEALHAIHEDFVADEGTVVGVRIATTYDFDVIELGRKPCR
jgi:hypothetical protein